ncbi:hypothetical protein ACOMHN_057290 [Nucella lapillus]
MKCASCNMVFGDPSLLQKHKDRFCVGSNLGDPDALRLRKGLRDPGRPPDTVFPEEEEETPRFDASRDVKVQQLAELHGKQMEFFKNQNDELERQREEIRRQLEALGRRQPAKDNSMSDDLLKELREEEERSRRMLEELRRQLLEARRPINVISTPAPEQPEPDTPRRHAYALLMGGSLVEEILAVKHAYIQNGGNDPDILAQLETLLAEARELEEKIRNMPKKQPKEKDDSQLISVELENKRLLEQLILLREQKILNKRRGKDSCRDSRDGRDCRDGRDDDLDRELRRMRRDHMRKMYDMQVQIERMRQDSHMDRMMLELHLQNRANTMPAAPPPPTRLILKQKPPPPPAPAAPPPPASPARQVTETYDVTVPYDDDDGFVIFYDFVLNLEPNIFAMRLLVGLHNMTNKLGEPSVMPLVYTEPAIGPHDENVCNTVIGARQPVRKCPPLSDLGIVTELQVAGAIGSNHDPTRLITRGWTKIPLFDGQKRLYTGRFKLPLRHSPIKPYIPFGELDDIAQYGDSELYYRIAHYRDATVQSMATISATHRTLYLSAPVNRFLPPIVLPPLHISPSPLSSTPPTCTSLRHSVSLPASRRIPFRSGTTSWTKPTLGFQVDRVKHSDGGEGRVRLTAYYASTGEVVQSESNPVTCTTTSVRDNFKQEYHVFGQQVAVFSEVRFQADMVLIALFYLTRRPRSPLVDMYLEPTAKLSEDPAEAEDSLVAWAALPLVLHANHDSIHDTEFDPGSMRINTGTQTLPLFLPPAPNPEDIPLHSLRKRSDWIPYHDATLRLHIFHCTFSRKNPELTPSEASAVTDLALPQSVWILKTRSQPPTEPFLTGDGFDVYIDGCRFLPDSVTFTRVAARVLDRHYQAYGKDMSSGICLDSDVYNPVYQHWEEFREPSIPPSAAFLFKVYTVDKFYGRLTVVGYAALNVFVETGTEKQPSVDKAGVQVSVNEGGHQLRLYQLGPDEDKPFTAACLPGSHSPLLPCASLLVRLFKVRSGPRGPPLQADQVPKADHVRLGLSRRECPRYSERVYLSAQCEPTPGETRLFPAMSQRRAVTVRKAVVEQSRSRVGFHNSDVNMQHYIRNKLMKTQKPAPLQQDLTFIAPYSPRHGIRCALYKGYNIPWVNFTFGHFCLNPPGAVYQGVPFATYDKPVFTDWLDPRSTVTCPAWQDGYVYYPKRLFHRYLCVIVYLQELFVTNTKKTLKYGLLKQAWTAVQVFKDQYASVSTHQLPLFHGGPTQDMLTQLANQPCKEWMTENIRSGAIKLVENASVLFRLSDARLDEEPKESLREVQVISTEYLPKDRRAGYGSVKESQPVTALIPDKHKEKPEEFLDSLASKFKSLVNKRYKKGGMGNK